MFFRNKVSWSLLDIDYLKSHREDDRNQLCLYMGKSRNAVAKKLLEIDGKLVPKASSKKRTNIGRREDLSLFVRSSWEANTLRYLNHLGHIWKYEPKTFIFDGIKCGTLSYLPDIYDETIDKWIEIKGYLDGKSKTAIRRFKKHYPEEFKKLVVIVGSENIKADLFFKEMNVPVFAYYNTLNKQFKDKKTIPNWE